MDELQNFHRITGLRDLQIKNKKWEKLNNYLSKRCQRKQNNSTLMSSVNGYLLKQQELKLIESLQEESTQFGCLRWMSGLRKNDIK